MDENQDLLIATDSTVSRLRPWVAIRLSTWGLTCGRNQTAIRLQYISTQASPGLQNLCARPRWGIDSSKTLVSSHCSQSTSYQAYPVTADYPEELRSRKLFISPALGVGVQT